MKLHFKIISHSSQDQSAPVTNLISGSGMWQSARFCQYPQQITIQFYDPVTVSSIHIASHPSKISSRVNVLFCLLDKVKLNSSLVFQKYGYFQFSDNQSTDLRLRELKKIQEININATYVRLIMWKNYQNPQNFFNQVGLSQLVFYGQPCATTALPPAITNKSGIMNLSISDYIEAKLQILQQFKQNFSKQDDFQSAKKIKEIIKVIRNHGDRLKNLDSEKRTAVGSEEYDKAKQIKVQMETLRHDIEFVINNFYDPHKKQIKPVLRQNKLKAKFDEIISNGGTSANQSRVSNKFKKVQMQILSEQKEVLSEQEDEQQKKQAEQQEEVQNDEIAKSRVSYDNRIVPAVLNKNKKQKENPQIQQIADDPNYEDNQFLEKPKNQEEIVLQDMAPSAQANAAVLIQLYDKEIVKKLHSKHWNFKLEALNTIMSESKKWLSSASELEKNRVKSVLFTFNKIIKEGNFQLHNLNLDLLGQLAGSKKPAAKNVQTQLHSDLQKSINELFLKMGDSQKIKQKCDEIIKKMQGSDLYGVNFVYQTISKSFFNQVLTHNVKIKKYKLTVIENMLMQSGIGSKNGLPLSAVEFMCKVAEDSNDEIRKQATLILKKMKEKGAGNKVIEVVRSKQSLKGSIVKQLQA